MTRDEITLELSGLVRSRIDRQCPLWGAEVDVPTGREDVPIGRVDFAGFTPYGYGYGYVPDASSLERGTLTCYEVKSCMADFRSGHGLNFVGDVNWLVARSSSATSSGGRWRSPRRRACFARTRAGGVCS